MITLYNSGSKAGRILDLALHAKGIKYTADRQPWQATNYPVLIDDHHVVQGLTIILQYLEHRYPAPNLIPNDPIHASIVMMLVERHADVATVTDYSNFVEHLRDCPFIAGEQPSYADVAISALAPSTEYWELYRQRLQKAWGSWENSL
jgi:glutathione S-transferase